MTHKQKRKNDSLGQRRPISFIALSMLTYAIAWGGSELLMSFLYRFTNLTMKKEHAVGFTLITLFIASVQVYLVERLFKHSMRRWLWYTMLGILVTLPLYRNDPEWPTHMTIFLSPLFPVAVAQTAWLWWRVRMALLWPLASIVGQFLMIMIMYLSYKIGIPADSSGEHLLMGLPYGLVQGLMLYYLWTQARQSEKAKVDFAAEHDSARIERLQTSEHLHASLPPPPAIESAAKHMTQ